MPKIKKRASDLDLAYPFFFLEIQPLSRVPEPAQSLLGEREESEQTKTKQ
jgi:hypothetical protein